MNDLLQIICGDAFEELRELPAESVHCCVTSPPYWGLRDYGTAAWEGGDLEHVHDTVAARNGRGGSGSPGKQTEGAYPSEFAAAVCKCGAKRIDSQLGLEKTPEEYVAKLVAVFREVRRVLRRDGTLWLNLGDSYASGEVGRHDRSNGYEGEYQRTMRQGERQSAKLQTGLKPKDLCGIPWRVAFALQADGWVLRSEIIWSKCNPMPESVTDRPTKAHEQLFLFSKARWLGPERGRFADITNEDARWLALCIDTEGCIVVKRVKQTDGGADAFGPQVTFGGTNRELVERFQQIVGHGNISERAGLNAPMFYWQISNNIARDFLYRIYPFLIVKQRQARISIHVDDLVYYRGGKLPSRKHRTPAENEQLVSLWSRNKECNQFGYPDLSDVPEPKYGRWDSQPYFYDAEAIKENGSGRIPGNVVPQKGAGMVGMEIRGGLLAAQQKPQNDRNKRSVWTVATAPYPEAHFATYPPDLIKPCIMAGTSAKGCCAKCGAPWERITERGEVTSTGGNVGRSINMVGNQRDFELKAHEIKTLGWRPTCDCDAGIEPCTVLDCFAGSGTTGAVALELGRKAVLIELNPVYVELMEQRCSVTVGLALA